MLNRSTSAPVWSPWRWLTGHLGALTGPYSGLLRYVLIAAVLSAIGCLYLWQVNDLSTLHEKTLKLEWQAGALEQQNVVLAEQLAQWNSPAYVDKRSAEQGYVAAPKRTIQTPAGKARATAAASAQKPAVVAAPVEPGASR